MRVTAHTARTAKKSSDPKVLASWSHACCIEDHRLLETIPTANARIRTVRD
jgi:hypothetical protein